MKMGVLSNLEPKKVFYYFEEITKIPHGSGNVEQISNFLVDFAKAHKLFYIQDAMKNIIMVKEATPGYEKEPVVILQGHMDMVAVQTPDCTMDMKTEGLKVGIDGDSIYAENTSPGISALIACTPLGVACKKAATRFVSSGVAQVIVSAVSANLFAVTFTSGSLVASSSASSAAKAATCCAKLSASFSSTTTTAFVCLGMALSANPPSADTSPTGIFSDRFHRSLPKMQLELPLSLWISPPECPPKRPETSSS